jgi:hypothetical protein
MARIKRGSSAERVFKWLKKYPYIIWALKNDLINYSALARKIQKELEIKNFDAVIVAIRRYQRQLKPIVDPKINEIIEKSRLDIRTGVNVYILEKSKHNFLNNMKDFHLICGDFTTLITHEKLDVDTIRKHENVVEVRLKSPAQIESMPGFVAYLYERIGELGINIIETYSSYTETIFIIEKADLIKILNLFEALGVK